MFKFKINGGLDIGNSGLRVVTLNKNKVNKIKKFDYRNLKNYEAEDKIVLLEEGLEAITQNFPLKGKNLVITIPASKFYFKIIETPKDKTFERLEEKIKDELKNFIHNYDKDKYFTEILRISESSNSFLSLVMTIPKLEIERIIGVLENFKIRVLKIIPDVIGLYSLIRRITSNKVTPNLIHSHMVLDIGLEMSKVFFINNETIKLVRVIGVGGTDFTEVIQTQKALDHKAAEKEKFELNISKEKRFETQGEITTYKEISKVLRELITQVESSIEYYQDNFCTAKNELSIYLTGGGAKLKGITEYINKEVNYPVEKIDLEILNIESNETDIIDLSYHVVIGALLGEEAI